MYRSILLYACPVPDLKEARPPGRSPWHLSGNLSSLPKMGILFLMISNFAPLPGANNSYIAKSTHNPKPFFHVPDRSRDLGDPFAQRQTIPFSVPVDHVRYGHAGRIYSSQAIYNARSL